MTWLKWCPCCPPLSVGPFSLRAKCKDLKMAYKTLDDLASGSLPNIFYHTSTHSILTASLFFKCIRDAPISVPLHSLFPFPGMLYPWTTRPAPSLTSSLCSKPASLRHHLWPPLPLYLCFIFSIPLITTCHLFICILLPVSLSLEHGRFLSLHWGTKSRDPEKCLEHSKCSGNAGWMNEQMNQTPFTDEEREDHRKGMTCGQSQAGKRKPWFFPPWDSHLGLSDCKAPRFLTGPFSELYIWAS